MLILRALARAEELVNEHGPPLSLDYELSVAARLTLRLLGVNVDAPSDEEVLKAVRNNVRPKSLPALAEVLGVHVEDVAEECAKYLDSEFCIDAYMAVKGNMAAEKRVREKIASELSIGVPHDLLVRLERVDVRELIEVHAPKNSGRQFILLLRALVRGGRDLALLHAEVGRARFEERLLRSLYGGLADALRANDEGAVRLAVAKLYYHF